MRFHRIVAAVFACASMLGAHAATAGSGPAHLTSLVGVPLSKVYLPGTDATLEVCKLGQFGTPVGAVGSDVDGGAIVFGDGDTYWTYLDLRPELCTGCDANYMGTLSMAHVALYFPFAPETVTVNLSVVMSVPIPCHYPNYVDGNAVICSPSQVTFDCQVPQSVVDFALPVPPGCGVTALAQPNGQTYGAAFLGIEFVSATDTTELNKPEIAVQAASNNCMSWNPVGFSRYDFVSEYLVGNPVMYAEVSRCDNVPVRRSTWGQLKMHYR